MLHIIEGKHLEYEERIGLEEAGRRFAEPRNIRQLVVGSNYACSIFRDGTVAVSMKSEKGDYVLSDSFCTKCRKRPLVPCAHVYAAALAAERLKK